MSCGRKNSIIRLTAPRRWLLSNLKLAQLITQKIGNNWIKQPDDLKQLETFADDAEFRNLAPNQARQEPGKVHSAHHNGIEVTQSRF